MSYTKTEWIDNVTIVDASQNLIRLRINWRL